MAESGTANSSFPSPPKVALFVTCLVDFFRPTVGFAAVKLLEDAGCTVEVPKAQTCCGQPAYNSGDKGDTKEIARQVIKTFEEYDYVVAPSGSCAGMIHEHYPELMKDDPDWAARAAALGAKTHELTSFLTDIMRLEAVSAKFEGAVTYHDSCAGLRELGVQAQPRKLLDTVEGLELKEMLENDACCGFGGTFCIKYPDISNSIVTSKTQRIEESGAKTLLAGDMGCLLNMAGKLQREGKDIQVRHVAEVLAGMTGKPAIGESGEG